MDSSSSSSSSPPPQHRYFTLHPLINIIRPLIYSLIHSPKFRYFLYLLGFLFTIPERFFADPCGISLRQAAVNVNMEDSSFSQSSAAAAAASAITTPNNYFPHFISTMIMIYFIGSGPVSIVIVLCVSAVAVALILRDPLLNTPIFPSTNLQSPEDVKAFAMGYRKGFADAKEEDRGECRRRRSGEGGTTATGRRLMGPPVVDQATTRLHQMHPHTVMNMQGADGHYEGVYMDGLPGF